MHVLLNKTLFILVSHLKVSDVYKLTLILCIDVIHKMLFMLIANETSAFEIHIFGILLQFLEKLHRKYIML